MAPPRRIPGERMAVRLGARLRRAEVSAVGGALQRRIARRLAPAGAPRPLLQRLTLWETSAMLGWTAAARTPGPTAWFGPWSGIPDMVLPLPDSLEGAPSSATLAPIPRQQPASVGVAPADLSPTAPRGVSHPALRRAERREHRGHPALALCSLWAERSGGHPAPPSRLPTPSPARTAAQSTVASARSVPLLAATDGRAPLPGSSGQPHRPSARLAVRRELTRPSRVAPPEAVVNGALDVPSQPSGTTAPTDVHPVGRSRGHSTAQGVSGAPGMAPPVTAFERLEQRTVRPIGLVSGDLGWSARPGHPAARGMEAAQPSLAGAVFAPEPTAEVPSAHPARGVLAALARAGSPEQVMQTIMERAAEPSAIRSLPAPLAEVVQQIQRQAQQAAAARPASAGARVARRSLARTRAEPRTPGAAERLPTPTGSGGDAQVVSLATQRLLRRLQQLVHIAETDRRVLEAQRRVRMAEDSAQARTEGSASPATASAGGSATVDLENLGRDVLAAVTHQFQARNERRQEDPDVRNDVWW